MSDQITHDRNWIQNPSFQSKIVRTLSNFCCSQFTSCWNILSEWQANLHYTCLENISLANFIWTFLNQCQRIYLQNRVNIYIVQHSYEYSWTGRCILACPFGFIRICRWKNSIINIINNNITCLKWIACFEKKKYIGRLWSNDGNWYIHHTHMM